MRILALLCSVFVLFAASDAHARPKPWVFSWWPAHWDNQDFKPYMDDSQMTHDTQWEEGMYGQEWHPENWIRAKGSVQAVIDDFYASGIIKEQDVDSGMPVLVVGDTFMNLSGQEKRRVADFIDYVYQVTQNSEAGSYTIYYCRTDNWIFGRGDPVGVYTTSGLYLN